MISTLATKNWLNQKNKGTGYVKYPIIKSTSVRGVTLTASHLVSFLNFAQLPYTAKLKIETKCAAVKVTPLTEVALVVRLIRTHSTVHL